MEILNFENVRYSSATWRIGDLAIIVPSGESFDILDVMNLSDGVTYFVQCIIPDIVEKYPFWVFYYFAQSWVFLGILFMVLRYPFKIPTSLFRVQ